MKLIDAPEEMFPSVKMQCDCGAEFWVDPHTEENLVFENGQLVEKCPVCGKLEEDKL